MGQAMQIKNLSKKLGRTLFEDVSLSLSSPVKVGLIGDNGVGKSVLLRIIAGKEEPDEGTVYMSSGCRVGYLEQEVAEEGWSVSGGEKKILRLTEMFFSKFNILLLDEPDNHLDLEHKAWFAELTDDFEGILVVVSHDRDFLKNHVQKIWLLEEQTVREYPRAYSEFGNIYELDRASRQHEWETQELERKRLEAYMKRMREWARLSDKFAGRYRSAVKRYEKFVREMTVKPPEDKRVEFASQLGKVHRRKTAILMKGVTKSFAKKKVLKGVDLHVFCGEKVHISAPNGAGKSTLLNVMAGRVEADGGTMRVGPNLAVGYYAQEHLEVLDEELTPIEELQKSTPMTWEKAVTYLSRFLFDKQQLKTAVRYLSGGQKSRLQLAKFLSKNPDILILDEPTNHLDVRSVESLEHFLEEYEGTLILVSHDKELVKNLGLNTYLLEEGKLNER